MEPRTIADLQRVKEDATLAAVCYGSFLYGHVVVSLVMLVYTREKSEYARFHAIQTLVAHLLALAALFVVGLVGFVVFFGSIASEVATNGHAHGHAGPPFLFLAVFPLFFLFGIGSAVASFTTAVLGILRAMDLRDLTLPLIGNWVFSRYFRGRRAAAAV